MRECQIRMTSAILFDGIIFIIICAQFGSKLDPVQQSDSLCFVFLVVWVLIRSGDLSTCRFLNEQLYLFLTGFLDFLGAEFGILFALF